MDEYKEGVRYAFKFRGLPPSGPDLGGYLVDRLIIDAGGREFTIDLNSLDLMDLRPSKRVGGGEVLSLDFARFEVRVSATPATPAPSQEPPTPECMIELPEDDLDE